MIWILWQFYKNEILVRLFCLFWERVCVAQSLHNFTVLLSQLPRFWDYRCTPLCLTYYYYYKTMLVVIQMRYLHKSQTFEYLEQLLTIWRGWRDLAGGSIPLGVGFKGSEDSRHFEFVLYASCLRCEPSAAVPADMPATCCHAATPWWTLMPLEQ